MTSLELDLSTLPLDQVVRLREEAERQVSYRRCRSRLHELSYVGCTLEKEHDGPHQGHSRATPPDSARPESGYVVTWHRVYDDNGVRLDTEASDDAAPSATPAWHDRRACAFLHGCTRCRSVVTTR